MQVVSFFMILGVNPVRSCLFLVQLLLFGYSEVDLTQPLQMAHCDPAGLQYSAKDPSDLSVQIPSRQSRWLINNQCSRSGIHS